MSFTRNREFQKKSYQLFIIEGKVKLLDKLIHQFLDCQWFFLLLEVYPGEIFMKKSGLEHITVQKLKVNFENVLILGGYKSKTRIKNHRLLNHSYCEQLISLVNFAQDVRMRNVSDVKQKQIGKQLTHLFTIYIFVRIGMYQYLIWTLPKQRTTKLIEIRDEINQNQ